MNLPLYIERTYPGVWPNRSITAPCYRDDGAKSHRDYTPLKSLKLNAKVSGAGTASAGLPGYAAGGNGERK